MKTSEIKQFRAKAHKLHPVVIIGGNGLTQSVHKEIDTALTAHELIKIRVNAEDADERSKMIAAICDQQEATLVQTIGHIAVIYREKNNQ